MWTCDAILKVEVLEWRSFSKFLDDMDISSLRMQASLIPVNAKQPPRYIVQSYPVFLPAETMYKRVRAENHRRSNECMGILSMGPKHQIRFD